MTDRPMDPHRAPEPPATHTADRGRADRPDGVIGPYRLVQPLGEGGMGEVWLAEQTHPLRRQVALKVIKAGMDTRQVIARFEAERQALAVMDHPAIATVFDGGATSDGRPYFVMEYVKGEPITAYCDRQRLTTGQRLDLFLDVAEGVQHAHQKGIIHRDLKPSNILVAVQDDQPAPKIIDFGVAKATAQPLTDRPLFTELGDLIGTPEYMSPEQAELTGVDIDTRTDVYALGVILYELLTGALPFDPKALRAAGLEALRRTIREIEPERPSTRVTGLGPDSAEIARRRRTEPGRLAGQLRGDLDWIVMKALDKDRTRRYQTANALAMDLRRHINNEPVSARPPSTTYRARRFARRHRFGVAAAGLLLLTLVLGMVGTSMGLVRARRAEAQAREEAATATEVSEFLLSLFRVSDPGQARGATVTAREILDRGAEQIRSDLQDEPRVQSRVLYTIGRVYQNLGLLDRARDLLEEALDKREALLGPAHLDVAETCALLGNVYREQGQYGPAESLLKRALSIREQGLSPDDPAVADSLTHLAALYENTGRFQEAESLFERAMAIRERQGTDQEGLALTLANLGILAAQQGNYKKAEPLLQRTLEIQETILGPDHPDVGTACNNLAIVYKLQRRYGDAEPMYARALEIRRRVLGPRHQDVADSLNNLGNLHLEQDHFDAAGALYREALAIYEQTLDAAHPTVARTIDNLAQLNVRQRKYQEAEANYRRALEIRQKALRADHPEIANNLYNLGELYRELKRYGEAERLFRRSLEIHERVLGAESARAADSAYGLGLVLRDTGRQAEALALLARAFDVRMRELPREDRDRVAITREYVGLLRELGRQAQADAAQARADAVPSR